MLPLLKLSNFFQYNPNKQIKEKVYNKILNKRIKNDNPDADKKKENAIQKETITIIKTKFGPNVLSVPCYDSNNKTSITQCKPNSIDKFIDSEISFILIEIFKYDQKEVNNYPTDFFQLYFENFDQTKIFNEIICVVMKILDRVVDKLTQNTKTKNNYSYAEKIKSRLMFYKKQDEGKQKPDYVSNFDYNNDHNSIVSEYKSAFKKDISILYGSLINNKFGNDSIYQEVVGKPRVRGKESKEDRDDIADRLKKYGDSIVNNYIKTNDSDEYDLESIKTTYDNFKKIETLDELKNWIATTSQSVGGKRQIKTLKRNDKKKTKKRKRRKSQKNKSKRRT